jgi:hypothetical protein
MAKNISVDPHPHVAVGFLLRDVPLDEPQHPPHVFLGITMDRSFENMAIAHFFPRVVKEDFKPMARALRLHLLTEFIVCTLDIQPCPIGDAFVGFNSPLQRRRFLDGPPLNFGGYSVRFEKHDERDNARALDMDREVWLLLVGYPLDARSNSAIAKAVSGFALLRQVHESNVMSRVVIKVVMNSETQVPPSIASGVGNDLRIRTWTVSVFVLSASSLPTLGDEDVCPTEGPLHPLPPRAAPWMGPRRECPFVHNSSIADDNDTEEVASGGTPAQGNVAQRQLGDQDMSNSQLSPAAQNFAASGGIEDAVFLEVQAPILAQPAVTQQQQVITLSPHLGSDICFFNSFNMSFLSSLDLNLDLPIRPFLSLSTVIDILRLTKDDDTVLPDASKEVLLECLENMDEIDPLPKKHLMLPEPSDVQKNKKACKASGPVDVTSLRRSSRLNKNSEGYKAQGAATRNSEQVFVGKFDKEVVELPPELSKENLQAIGSGFLKIQPMAVSDAALFAISDDDEA